MKCNYSGCKKVVVFILLLCLGPLYVNGQTIELTFTSANITEWIQIDSIKVLNRKLGEDTCLYWPDTSLIMESHSGISEIDPGTERLQVFQNYPNPMIDQTTLSIYIPEKDNICMIVTDVMGRVIFKADRMLDNGIHSFRFTASGRNLYFFTAHWRGMSSSIKILQHANNSSSSASLEYIGGEEHNSELKLMENILSFCFNPGDTLIYIGFSNGMQSGMLDNPEASADYTFQFATNVSCPGTPNVDYGGQVYNTIQIFSQCWLKENLNHGTMIQGDVEMSDNNVPEKYCYNNEPDSCIKYGGLYQWDEIMQYQTEQGSQGICPPGWHIPTDDEWKVLEGSIDSQYKIGDQSWEEYGWRGIDAGTRLKSTSGWYGGGNGNDMYGFSARANGVRQFDGSFEVIDEVGMWWTSTEYEPGIVFYRFLFHEDQESIRGNTVMEYGISVRCIKD